MRELPYADRLIVLRIKREGRKLWACLMYKIAVSDVVHDGPALPIPLARGVGIGMSVINRAALSDGGRVALIEMDKRRQRRLQWRISRANKNTNSRRRKLADYVREKNRLALSAEQVRHMRGTESIRGYDFIAFEDLQIKNMTKSAK